MPARMRMRVKVPIVPGFVTRSSITVPAGKLRASWRRLTRLPFEVNRLCLYGQ